MRDPIWTRILAGSVAVGLASWAMACSSEPLAGPPSEGVSTVSVLPAVDTAIVGHTMQFRATLRCQHGDTLNRAVAWQSSNPAVAIVSGAGLVTGVSRGTATITATSEGRSGSAGVLILAPVNAVSIEPAVVTLDVDETSQLTAALRDNEGNVLDRPITWASSNTAIVDVSAAGLIRAVGPGAASITAASEGKTGSAAITVLVPVKSVDVTPLTGAVSVGSTLQLAAVPRDAAGGALNRPVAWESSDPAIATVDANGLVSGLAPGTVTITATSRGAHGTVTVTVRVPVDRVTVSDPGPEPVAPGDTLQLTATAFDAGGAALTGRAFTWASSDNGIATVDNTGLVTGVSQGTVTISATSEGKVGSVSVRVAGEATTLGNNLSNPVVFADGIGVTGLPVTTDAGLRPTAAESIAVTRLPFWYNGNLPDYQGRYYLQQGKNVWQAQWLDGSTAGVQQAEVDWGDNLSNSSFNTHQNIRIEVVLNAINGPQMTGFNMTTLYGSGADEMQGTDGSQAQFTPTIYTVLGRLIIEKLNDTTRDPEPMLPVFNGAIYETIGVEGPGSFGAEVNVGGRLVFGYNLLIQQLSFPSDIHKYGWYRITFQLDNAGDVGGVQLNRNVELTRLAASSGGTYVPQIDPAANKTWIDINVRSASGGGGGGH